MIRLAVHTDGSARNSGKGPRSLQHRRYIASHMRGLGLRQNSIYLIEPIYSFNTHTSPKPSHQISSVRPIHILHHGCSLSPYNAVATGVCAVGGGSFSCVRRMVRGCWRTSRMSGAVRLISWWKTRVVARLRYSEISQFSLHSRRSNILFHYLTWRDGEINRDFGSSLTSGC